MRDSTSSRRIPSYASSSLDARRARGGNGAVTRVLVADGRVALETRRLVVGFEQTTTESAVRDIFETLHLVPIRRIPFGDLTWHLVADDGLATNVCLQLMEREDVRFAEPDFIEHVGQRATMPSDPLIAQQWHHQVIGTTSVWPRYSGEGVRLAVVDNGFMTTHPDLGQIRIRRDGFDCPRR